MNQAQEYPTVEVIDDQDHYCACCGYPSDDLMEMVLEDALRKKRDVIICGVCSEAPWMLDSYLNPYLYSKDACAILHNQCFLANKLLDSNKEVLRVLNNRKE